MLLLSFYLSSPIQLAHRMALGLLALTDVHYMYMRCKEELLIVWKGNFFLNILLFILFLRYNLFKNRNQHYETKKSFNCDCRCHIHPIAALLAFCSRRYQCLAACKLKTWIFHTKHLSLFGETFKRFQKTFKSFAGNA